MGPTQTVRANEPTAGLDADAVRDVLEQFTQAALHGRAVVIASHDDVVAAVCSRTVTLNGGELRETPSVEKGEATR
jgi:putative ABC transport system ATP-binding protein